MRLYVANSINEVYMKEILIYCLLERIICFSSSKHSYLCSI